MIAMKNTRITRLEQSLQKEIAKESLNIVLGSICYESNTMYLCVEGGFTGTIEEGEQYMEDHPENIYVTFGDPLHVNNKPAEL
jgi:hypothetical protein